MALADSTEKITAQSEICLKEYGDKFCNQNSALKRCKELLACINEQPSIGYFDILGLASQQLNNDFWFPASLIGLLMLFRVSESTAANMAEA